jgi:hypothetical protein
MNSFPTFRRLTTKHIRSGSALAVILVGVSAMRAATPPPVLLNYTNHWAGNTGGKGGATAIADAISNFVVDMAVLNASDLDWQFAPYAPLVITKSYWDETQQADGAYSKGIRVSKGEFFNKSIAFDTSTYAGVTAKIAHPHPLDPNNATDKSQQGYEDQGLALTPFQNNLPYVSLSDGRSIKSVAYPTNVAFDNTGRLWVADNGPDQNFKIFTVGATGAPVLSTTFGEPGGVFAGPTKGLAGPKRFWGPRGVGFGSDGQIIVGCSGIPGQIQGGTDIRWFDPTGNTLNYQAIGTFLHVADFDPTSDGKDLYSGAVRYEMDYTKPPGQSWKFAAVTLDPFRFPDDPRANMPLESAYIRRIAGKRFLFCTNMVGGYLAVFRFEENSEIAVPAAFFYLFASGQGAAWADGLYPV